MRSPVVRIALVAGLAVLAALAWRAQLVRVGPDETARPLALLEESRRATRNCDVVLPAVPVGMTRVHSGGTPLLVHYWAPWERNGRAQAAALDSLVRTLGATELRVVLVTSDPFPSVARFVQRHRLKLRVLLDGPGLLRAQIPRPRLPHTVVLGRDGREWVVQSGHVDWLSAETRAVIDAVTSAAGDSGAGAPPPSAPPRVTL